MDNLLPELTYKHGGEVLSDGSVFNNMTRETLAVGDYVETYHKGLWRITGFAAGNHYDEAPVGYKGHIIAKYEKVLGADWKDPKGKKNEDCDIWYLRKVTLAKVHNEAAARMSMLRSIGVPAK